MLVRDIGVSGNSWSRVKINYETFKWQYWCRCWGQQKQIMRYI